jgi:predicted ATPase
MINSVKIEGFKRFKSKSFDLRRLSILAGRNGSGKTSIIQAILLAREALLSKEETISLNGPFGLQLGTFDDVANKGATEGFSVEVREGSSAFGARFSQPEKPAQQFYVHSLKLGTPSETFARAGRAFQYLGAERIGPRLTSTISAVPQQFLNIGPIGENAAQILDSLGALPVLEGRQFDSSSDVALLKDQTEAWLSALTRPIQIDTETYPYTPIVTLKYRTDIDWLSPTNMGFGVTYALPIVVAALTTEQDGLLIVENPEAHLAPSGQTQVGIFLTKIAASGVQVLLETHSDHVINGIRRAIGELNLLASDDAIIHFLDSSTESEALTFTASGGISHWPQGFFDQYQIDVATLTRIRRKGAP